MNSSVSVVFVTLVASGVHAGLPTYVQCEGVVEQVADSFVHAPSGYSFEINEEVFRNTTPYVGDAAVRSLQLVLTDGVDYFSAETPGGFPAVTNFDEPDSKYRSCVAVGVAYGSDTGAVRDLLLRAADEHERVLSDPAPVALFQEFGDNALAFELHVWITTKSVEDRLRIESDLRYRIDELCRDAEISIAFPQRDVHLDTTRPLEVRVTPGA